MSEVSSTLPLEGITILSIEQAVAAPYCTRLLADLGASVIKVERPGSGDFARHYDTSVKGESAYFAALNAGKKSVTVNIQHQSGREIVKKLIERSDVFVHNLRQESIQRLDLDFEAVRVIRPDVIYCGISGYGNSGPLSNEKAYDLILQGESGVIALTGYPDSPAKVGISICDVSAGMFSALKIVAALHQRRDRKDFGQQVDTTLFGTILDWVAPQAYYSIYTNSDLPRTGMKHNTIAPYGPYLCSDGKYVICAVQHNEEWKNFCERVLERPDLITNELYSSNEARIRNRVSLEGIIEKIFLSQPYSYWWDKLGRADIARGNVNSAKNLFSHPQIAGNESTMLEEILSQDGKRKISIFKSPLRPSRNMDDIRKLPALGEDTVETLLDLGYSTEDIKGLQSAGIV